MNVALGLVSHDDNVVTSLDDISTDDQVIVISGTTAETYLEKEYPDIQLQKFDAYAEAKTAFENGTGIAVPNDTTNEARALLLLEANGVITLKDGAGLTATVADIEENPYNIDIEELKAAQVSRVTGEVAFVVLNGNYALEAGYSVAQDAIAYETNDSEAAQTYVNIIAVKAGNEDNEGVQALGDVLKSDEIKQFINDTYDGAVSPFED